ncbi:alpha/beta fold hydrolase [Sciscionella sediminilitoris]|uniref:alpha/beta fold hydrolase n=1 Tax=Sciscionella sediminilitoris TaxID=1445613 RepID=UPI0004DEF157|nr:alpha/beta fold hydrolase [Sciscionella sp. SE31]
MLRELLELTTWRAFDVHTDGRVLAGHDESGTTQLVEIGTDGTVRKLTTLDGACSGRYVPGTDTVLVSHDTGGNERAQISRLHLDSSPLPSTMDDLEAVVRDPSYIHGIGEVTGTRMVYRTNRRNGVDFDIVVHELATGTESVIYDGGGWAADPAVHTDGRRVALTRPGRYAMSDQLLLACGGEVTELTGELERAQYHTVHWVGDSLVLTTNRDREFTGIARYTPETGDWRWLVTDDAHDVTGWPSPDGTLLLVHTNVGGVSRLAVHDADGNPLREVPLPDGWLLFPLPEPVWAADSRSVALTLSGPEIPGDVLVVDAGSGTTRAVTDSAAALRGLAGLSVPDTHWVPGAGGDIPCYVYRPSATAEPLSGAAVLLIHGGPEGQSALNFNPIVQGLAAAGFTVLVPNVRGSVGYGKAWYSADDVRARMNSVDDLAALHDWLPSLGLDRAALWGGSYGGYMVLAGLAFQPQLWSAGVDIVGMSSLVTFLENTSVYRRAQREREYGSLAEDREFLESISPLSRIADIRAPLFVIHGANDPRVPLSEAEQLHTELGNRGVACELCVYADEGHGLAKRVNRLDAYPRALEFLTARLGR